MGILFESFKVKDRMSRGQILKVCFGIVNVVMFIFGLAMFSLSIWVLVNPLHVGVFDVYDRNADYDTRMDALFGKSLLQRFDSSLYLVLFPGLLIMFVTSLGFFGTCKESKCTSNVYAMVMGMTIVIQLAATIVVFVSFTDTALDDGFIELIGQYNASSAAPEDVALVEIVDQFHNTAACCGWKPKSIWSTAEDNFEDSSIPDSCYAPNCGPNYDEPCVGEMMWIKDPCKDVLEAYGFELGGISIVCMFLEAVAIAGA